MSKIIQTNSENFASKGIFLGSRVTFKDRILNLISKFIYHKIIKFFMRKVFLEFSFECTNICNANCSFCGYRFMRRKKTKIDEEIFFKCVDQYDKLGGGTLNFTPTVGDPLVDKNLLEKIKYAKSKKNIYSITSYTNGILLDRFGFKNILTSGITRLGISTYIGTSEGYKKYYGKDQYNRVINNIVELAKLNSELNFPVGITLHLRLDGNISNWERSEDFVRINQYIPKKNITYLKMYDSWNGLIDIDDIPENCEIDDFSESEEVKKKSGPCFELYRALHVMSDSNVGACVCKDMEGEISVGNAKNDSLEQIWKGKKLENYRSNWGNNIPEVCKTCTRYMPVDDYIKKSKPYLTKKLLKKFFKSFSSQKSNNVSN